MNKKDFFRKYAALYILLWFFINLLFLMAFPFVHTDEIWLSGLSRFMGKQGSLFVTEPFFDVFPRHPHAIRILYHGLELLFFKLAGYGLFQARLLSLLAGAGVLVTSLLLSEEWGRKYSSHWPFLFPLWLSLDIQFIYASHFARQEVFLLFFMLLSLLFFTKDNIRHRALLSGLMIALSIGFHPNSFIISLPVGFLWFYRAVKQRTERKNLLHFVAVVFTGAFIFTGLSLLANPGFFADYASSGKAYGVLESPDIKIIRWPLFYQKLLHRISGTYYLPDHRISLILFAAAAVAIVRGIYKKKSCYDMSLLKLSLTGMAVFNLGLIVLGKYSQPSLVFLTPFILIFILASIMVQNKRKKEVSALVFTLLIFCNSLINILPETAREKGVYKNFLSDMKQSLPEGAVVLSTLYLEPVLPSENLHDWRNLAELKSHNMTLKDYIEKKSITHIVIPDEIEFFYDYRPMWNSSYGNPVRYYDELIQILSEAELTGSPVYPGYSMRLSRYRFKKEWAFRIYELRGFSSKE